MLEKFKTLIFNYFNVCLGLIVVSVLFFLTTKNIYFLPLFFIGFLVFNFYFVKGPEILLGTLFWPIPFFFLPILFQLQPLITTSLWVAYLLLIWFMPLVGWLIFMFLFLLLLNFFSHFFGLVWMIGLLWLLMFILARVAWKNDSATAALKALIVTEAFWLVFFLPLSFYFRSLLVLLAIVILRRQTMI